MTQGTTGTLSVRELRLIQGGSASRISNTCSPTDPGGGGIPAPTRTNKPVWVSPVVNPRHPGWSPSEQSYPPLGCHQVPQPPESIRRAGRKPHLPARPPMMQIYPAIKEIRIVSERFDPTTHPGFRGSERHEKSDLLDREEGLRGGLDAVLG